MEIHKPETDDKLITEILTAIAGYQAVLVAYDLKLFERLYEKPLTLDEVCEALRIVRRPAQALLTVCMALGLVAMKEGRYELTPVARDYLVESSPFYVGKLIDFDCLQNASLYSYDSVKAAILSDRSQAYDGKDMFQTHIEQTDMARQFTAMMHAHSVAPASAWIEKLDLSRYATMLDIGGGSGVHAIAATRYWENLQAIVFDLPSVCQLAEQYIGQSGLQNRIQTQTGDIWKADFPPSDLHFYSDIFHDWSAERCIELAKKSFASLERGGRIVLHEMLLRDDKSGPFAVAAATIGMLLWNAGQQYSGQELSEMLAKAGFVEIEVIPTFGYWHLVTGIKP